MGLSSETVGKNRFMVGVSIATVWEFEATLDYFHVQETERITYPYGEYFCRTINGRPVIFYSTGVRKVNGVGGNQYMLSHFPITKVLVVGTCAVVMWRDYLELQENGITVADTEAGAIAYICRKNEVECIIIKGISDVPTDETDLDPLQSNQEQINVYIENTPKVMMRIFDEYLPLFI
ncbi:5'-methylthioadenosine/S-adenosylhomocysteine nucleosidase family protein [Exiguobacterium artemiae]